VSGQNTADADGTPGYRVLGQPTLADTSLESRCPAANARFGGMGTSGDMFGPSGIAVDMHGRLYVTDYGGQRVLTWLNVDSLAACQAADGVIGVSELSGPEAVAIDPDSRTVFVADTLSHTVRGYRRDGTGAWTRTVRLGTEGASGSSFSEFKFPRGLAMGGDGRLYVADDFNNRVLIFAPPFTDGASAVDSIHAGKDGGFAHPKAVAAVGQSLFVADYDKNRVLRFTGRFDTPTATYVASGTFTGLSKPVDLAVHPDGSLLVTDQGNRRVARYDDAATSAPAVAPSSSFSDHVSAEPLGVCADRTGRIYIADYRSFRVLIRDEALTATPVGGAGSAKAGALLADLHARPARSTHRVAIGQHLITWLKPDSTMADPDGWYKDWYRLSKADLPLPRGMGGELVELADNSTNELISHGGKAGNMVTVTWHAPRPGDTDRSKFKEPMPTSDLRTLTDPATSLGQLWKTNLDKAAAVLQQFKDKQVPVLFRPMHEQNAPFFWWAHDGSKGAGLRDRQAAWVALWRHMVSTLAAGKGLDNLLFVFAPHQIDFDWAPPLTYYPGAGWVDVVGIDVYNDELNLGRTTRGLRHYAALVGTGKPFGLTEFGRASDDATGTGTSPWDARTVAQRVRDSYQRTTFAVAWNSSVIDGKPEKFALADAAFTKELLEDPLIETQ